MRRVPPCRECGERRAVPALDYHFCTKRCAAQWAVGNAEEATATMWNPKTDEWEGTSYDEDMDVHYFDSDTGKWFRIKYNEDGSAKDVSQTDFPKSWWAA